MSDSDIFDVMSRSNNLESMPLQELRVLSGLHKGAALILSAEHVTIGSDLSCSVVLLDEGVKPLHLTLQWIKGAGWSQSDAPDTPLSSPFPVGPVWISVVSPGSPWGDLDLLRFDDVQRFPRNTISAISQSVSLRLSSLVNPARTWALWSVFATSACLLLISVVGWETGESSTIDFARSMAKDEIAEYNAHQPEAPVLQRPEPENPNKEVVAVVSGVSEFVLMHDGQRIHVGDEFGQFVLMSVNSSESIWRHKLYLPAEE